jgi:hypothetical protein
MSSEETDAVPTNLNAIDDYYQKYSKTFLKSSSSETISSSNSATKRRDSIKYDYDSSIASDSDFDEEKAPHIIQGENLAKVNGENVESHELSHINSTAVETNKNANNVPNINSLAISNSTDVHIGNKTIYNAPVTIKQIVIRDRGPIGVESNGKINNGYEGN